jgi:hypothetical protein
VENLSIAEAYQTNRSWQPATGRGRSVVFQDPWTGDECRFRLAPFVFGEKQGVLQMTSKLLTTVVWTILLGGIAASLGARSPEIDAAAAFERLKALQGTWEAPAANGHKATTTFELTAGDTVLLERYSNPALPGGGHMVSAYHLDGRALVLTHYCIARNQPTLKAERFDAKTGEIHFEFLRATNLPTSDSGHMRRALYRIEDANHFTTEWEFFDKGKKTMTEVEKFSRVK